MKKTFTLLGLLTTGMLAAQVSITYQVDVTNYLAGGETLNPNGIRVGGNFATYGGTTGGNAMADWSPADANSAMTDMGNGMWEITVDYPAGSIGSEQLYKFVNGDWGTNEGTAGTMIVDGGCGLDDGGGNINRTLTIPQSNATVTFCWDMCEPCNVGLQQINKVSVAVFPNPASDELNFVLDETNFEITLSDLSGKVVSSSVDNQINIAGLNSGVYIYNVETPNGIASGKFVKK